MAWYRYSGDWAHHRKDDTWGAWGTWGRDTKNHQANAGQKFPSQKKRLVDRRPDKPDLDYLETMIATREKNPDLEQPHEWSSARDKVLRNVMEVCKTVCPTVLEVGSGFRGTSLPYSDIDVVCLFDSNDQKWHHARCVEKALQKLSDSIDRRDDYFDEEDDYEGGQVCLNGKWVCGGKVHQIEGCIITWSTGEISVFQQVPDGLICENRKAKLRGASLIWPRETWMRMTFSNQHIARKWPDPPPKPMLRTIKKASELRYAQDTISDKFWDGKPLKGLVDDIISGTMNLSSHDALVLDCVEIPSGWGQKPGEVYCVNNRRLWCIKESSNIMGEDLSVQVKVYRFSDCAGFWQSRLTTVNGGCRVSIRSMDNTGMPTGDMPERMSMAKSKRKSEYLHLIVDGFQVDVLASGTKTLKGQELADALLDTAFGQRNVWAPVCAAAQNQLRYTQRDSEAVKLAVKLAKLWAWYVAFPQWDQKLQPRSYLIELIVRHCLETASPAWSPWEVFVDFLKICAAKRIQPIMSGWERFSSSQKVKWGKGPRVIDPVNPTNNVAKPFRFWWLLRKYARLSLQRIDTSQGPERTAPRNSDFEWQGGCDETFEDMPQMAPPNIDEVCGVLSKMGLPRPAVQQLIAEGFTSLEALCSLGKEADFLEAGMNKVQARYLIKAIETGGFIFKKLQSEGRLPDDLKQDSGSTSGRGTSQGTCEPEENWHMPRDGCPTSTARPRTEEPSIPLMCYPAGSPQARCLLFGTLVPVGGDDFLKVENLRPQCDFIRTPNGPLRILKVTKLDADRWWLVQLEAGGASLTVTDSHRIACVKDGALIEKMARDLTEGDVVQTSQGVYELSIVKHLYEPAKVVELRLNPDEAFEAFHRPAAAILSKGQAHSSTSRPLPANGGTRFTRRGGQNRRNAAAAANRANCHDAYSHVDTAYSDW